MAGIANQVARRRARSLLTRGRAPSVFAKACRSVPVLERDQERLGGPQQAEAQNGDRREPEDCVEPVGRRVRELQPERERDDDTADDEHHEG